MYFIQKGEMNVYNCQQTCNGHVLISVNFVTAGPSSVYNWGRRYDRYAPSVCSYALSGPSLAYGATHAGTTAWCMLVLDRKHSVLTCAIVLCPYRRRGNVPRNVPAVSLPQRPVTAASRP
eukprot:2189256-Rhodomonas_salina.1